MARDNLPWLVSNLTSNSINKFERKISGKKDLPYLVRMKIWMMSDIIKIIKSLVNSSVLIYRIIETVKHEKKS